MYKVRVAWCPIRERVCSRDEEEVLNGRRGLCVLDTSTSDCVARRQGFDTVEVEAYVVDGTIVLNEKEAIRMLLKRIKITIDEIEEYLKNM